MELFSSHSLAVWFLLFLAYSCAGWVSEIIVTSLQRHRRITNRGFFIGPICPIYGVGALIGTFLVGNVENILVIFCVSVVGAALLEYSTSFIMEKLFHVRWWDYSDQPLNINGRVCLWALVGFGIAGVFIVRVFNPLLFSLFDSLDPDLLNTIAVILAVIFAVDVICSLIFIFGFRVTVGTVERDATEEISERVHAIIMKKSCFSRRIAKAFPNYQPKKPVRRSSTKSTKTAAAKNTKSTTTSRTRKTRKSTKSRR